MQSKFTHLLILVNYKPFCSLSVEMSWLFVTDCEIEVGLSNSGS